MKSSHLFSFDFDASLLQREYGNINENGILHHNTGFYDGEWSGIAIRKPKNVLFDLDAGNADLNNFEDTPIASKAPYIKEILDFFKCEKTSVRLLKLTAGSFIKPHSDERLSFFDGYVRLHIPVVTNPEVEFIMDGESLKMLPGQCWFADFSKTHSVANHGNEDRIHLIIDLKVNDWLYHLFVEEGIMKAGEQAPDPMDEESVEFKKATVMALYEQGSSESKALARELIERYQLDIDIL